MDNNVIYLDNASSAPIDLEICNNSTEEWRFANPNNLVGKNNRLARQKIEKAEKLICKNLGGSNGKLYWLSSGSEANRLAIESICKSAGHLLTTPFEHKSIKDLSMRYGNWLPPELSNIPSLLEQTKISPYLNPGLRLLSIQAVNNETGSCLFSQGIWLEKALKKQLNSKEILIHSDITQAIGRLTMNLDETVDLATFSSHKLHGPRGLGCLWISNKVKNSIKIPYLGTPNPGAIVDFSRCLEKYRTSQKTNLIAKLDCLILDRLLQINKENKTGIERNRIFKNTTSYGILNLYIPGINSIDLVLSLEKEGIIVSSGAACNKGEPSYVLESAGYNNDRVNQSIRVSISSMNTEQEIDTFCIKLKKVIEELKTNESTKQD